MEWTFWPAAAWVVLLFVVALLPQHKTWVKLAQVAMGLFMLAFVVKGGWVLFWQAVSVSGDDSPQVWIWGLLYVWVTFALLTPWNRSEF